ncbi:MAG: hypothetical protein ABEK50_00465 [bacterium]
MRKILSLGVFLLMVLTACSTGPLAEKYGGPYYTQVGLWAQGGKHTSRNFENGRFIPVNTRVYLIKSSRKTLTFRVPDRGGMTLEVINKPEYSGENIKDLFARTFDEKKVNLGRFSKSVAEAIRKGELQSGMSKQAVLLARGYPPVDQTSSRDSSVWTYWESRYRRFSLTFENGELTEINR